MTYRKIFLMLFTAAAIISASRGLSIMAQSKSSPAQASSSIGLDDYAAVPGMKTTDEMIKFWQGRFERDQRDFISLTFLGDAYIRKARETGDVSEYQRADATLHKALEMHPNYDVAQAYLSTVRYVQHDFQGALDLASKVYTVHPDAVSALATMGDAQLELGRYAEAKVSYAELNKKAPSAPVYTRLARLAWLHGDPTGALNLMQQAIVNSDETGLTGENAAWYHFQLGEVYFNTGQIDKADLQYTAALNSFDNYYLALAGLGKISAVQGHYNEAIEYYKRAVAIIPQPDLLSALGDLYQVTGLPDKAKQQYNTVEFIGKLEAINKVIYNRQLALFYANHNFKLDESLQLAQNELKTRKDIYAYDTYAWALYKNHRYAEALDAMQQAMSLNTRDALLYYHAGMIYEAVGDTDQAETSLAQAMQINPHFDLLQARIAQNTLSKLQAQAMFH